MVFVILRLIAPNKNAKVRYLDEELWNANGDRRVIRVSGISAICFRCGRDENGSEDKCRFSCCSSSDSAAAAAAASFR